VDKEGCKLNQRLVKKTVDWSFFAVTFVYLLTGLGITHYRVVDPLTFGLLSKNLSFSIHERLLIPFVALLTLHLIFKPILWLYSGLRGGHKARKRVSEITAPT